MFRHSNVIRRGLLIPTILGLIFAVLVATPSYASPAGQEEAQVFRVLAGYEDLTNEGLQVEAFLPAALTIKAGDTVTWDFALLEPHTVTFLSGAARPADFIPGADGRLMVNPAMQFPAGGEEYDGTGFANSGLNPEAPIGGPFSYSLTFTTPGSFQYVCLIHPQQFGTVTVLAEDAPPVFSPEIVSDNMVVERDGLIAEINNVRSNTKTRGEIDRRDDGTAEYEVLAGISSPNVDLMVFDQPDLNIAQGDTVTWSWKATSAPHNVLFLPADQEMPFFIIPEFKPDGPPDLIVNPVVLKPAGGEDFDPTKLLNSGVRLNPAAPPPIGFAGGETYSLTFSEQGTFSYVCSLHFPQGMVGTIIVGAPRPMPPAVGDYSPSPWTLFAMAGLGAVFIVSGGLVIRRRRALREVRIQR